MTIFEWTKRTSSLPYLERRREIQRFVRPAQSRFLYKYRAIDPESDLSIERLRSIVVGGELWFSSPLDFNDPFDMSMSIVLGGSAKDKRRRYDAILKENGVPFKKRQEMVGRLARTPTQDIERLLRDSHTKQLGTTGVFSFAGDPRNILMWSHYAQDHSGVCLQFERARDYQFLSAALLVRYSPDFPVVDWTSDFQESLSEVLLRKFDGWAYEKEERIIRLGEANSIQRVQPEALTAIIMGCRISSASEKVISNLMAERLSAGYPLVRIYRAREELANYALRLELVDDSQQVTATDS
ncbi:MAG: DUF2971 domain-containing protein [Pseudomonadota bacterium]